MKASARRPTVLEGIGVALVGSIAGAGAFAVLSMVLDALGLFRLLVAVLALGYVVYLLARSGQRVGRLSMIAVWLALAVANLVLVSSPLLYVVVHLAMIWLVRTLYYYHGVLPALMDLGLMAGALATGLWVGETTHSLFLSLWCFFLIQALFVLIHHRPWRIRPDCHRRRSVPDMGAAGYRDAHPGRRATRRATAHSDRRAPGHLRQHERAHQPDA